MAEIDDTAAETLETQSAEGADIGDTDIVFEPPLREEPGHRLPRRGAPD